MSKVRVLFVGEPVESFTVGLDTGVLLAQEMVSRGIALDYLDTGQTDWRIPTDTFLGQLPIKRIKAVHADRTPAFELGLEQRANVQQYRAILHRKDPPVDAIYLGFANHFSAVPASILQVNNPRLTSTLCEHLLPLDFPKYGATTYSCETEESFLRAVLSSDTEVVAKPSNYFSGYGIEFFSKHTPPDTLKQYFAKWKPRIVVQPFLPEVETIGDLRILVMNQRIVGSVLRKPKTGSRLANITQGGSAHKATPTPLQLEATAAVSKTLCPRGLYLLGLDFIGEKLTEVNITCPATVVMINEVMGIRAEVLIIDELIRLMAEPSRQLSS